MTRVTMPLFRSYSLDNAGVRVLAGVDCQTTEQLVSQMAAAAWSGSWRQVCESWESWQLDGGTLEEALPAMPTESYWLTITALALLLRGQIFVQGISQCSVTLSLFEALLEWANGRVVTREDRDIALNATIEARLTISAIARARMDFKRAWFHAQRALDLLHPRDFRYGDALFASALSLSNLRRTYDALALYSRARKLPSTSPYRAMMCSMNEAYERLLISDIEGARRLVSSLPHERACRLKVMMDLLENNSDKMDAHRQILNDSSVPFTERDLIWIYLAEDALLRRPVDWLFLSELSRFLKIRKQNDSTDFGRAICHLLAIRAEGDPGTAWLDLDAKDLAMTMSQKDLLDFLYLRILVGCAIGRNMTSAYRQFSELMHEEGIRDPLLPVIESLAKPTHPFHARLASTLRLRLEEKPRFYLSLARKSIRYGDKDWDLKKSPQTLCLLTALAANQPVIEKRIVHDALTGTRYASHLHDARIWMLLARIRKQFVAKWGVEPFQLPGDNTIHLLISITSEDT